MFAINSYLVGINAKIFVTMALVNVTKALLFLVDAEDRKFQQFVADKRYVLTNVSLP